ncbi:MAG TPA: hypothetical protein VFV27_06505, partial [Nevskiaceae bacterium]|nr:hypothetical protein [Nevskiaceae bacterium]
MLRALPRVGLTRHAPTRLLLLSAAGLLLLWSLSRGLLLLLSAERWQADLLPGLLATGLRVDLIAVGVALALPILLWPLLASRHTEALWWRLSRGWIGLIAVAALVLEITTPTFISQYESRPNHLAVEYLRDWDSVLPMLWVGFRLPLLAGLGVLLAGLLLV